MDVLMFMVALGSIFHDPKGRQITRHYLSPKSPIPNSQIVDFLYSTNNDDSTISWNLGTLEPWKDS